MSGCAHRHIFRGSEPEQLHHGRLGKNAGLVTFVLKCAPLSICGAREPC